MLIAWNKIMQIYNLFSGKPDTFYSALIDYYDS